MVVEVNFKTTEQHLSCCHFIDEGIEPLDEEQFIFRRVTSNGDRLRRNDLDRLVTTVVNARAALSNSASFVGPIPRTRMSS